MDVQTDEASLYARIGRPFIELAIAEFYQRAFSDGIIGHFFFTHDQAHLTAQQIEFVTGLLGGPGHYRGKPLPLAHAKLSIRPPHFARRQVLMAEVLRDLGLAEDLINAWLGREEQLRAFVMQGSRQS